MTATVSEAFAAADVAAEPGGSPETASDRPRTYTRIRARGYRSRWVVRKVGPAVAVAGADLRRAWWTPASLPTVQQAWQQRRPDRERVPGDNAVLYGGWVVYNHTVALAVPAVAVALVGALTPLVWVALHPARFILAALIAAPLIFIMIG